MDEAKLLRARAKEVLLGVVGKNRLTAFGENNALDAMCAFATTIAAEATEAQGFDVDERGDITLRVVWALKPGEPRVVAICRSDAIAERYRAAVHQNYPGATFYVEQAVLDHAFGRRDMQSMIYRAAIRNPSGGAGA